MKVKIKDLFYEIKKYDIDYVAIDYYFKTYYDIYYFIDVRTFQEFKDNTGNDVTGICYEGFAFIDLNWAFTGLYDSKNNKLIKIKDAYESSIINFDDLKEIADIEKEVFNTGHACS